jgi:coenzyme F420-reducing hydrogenase delta subunit
VNPEELQALWDDAAAEMPSDIDRELVRLAREGHVNRDAILAQLTPGADECPCGEDDCEFWMTPEKIKRAAVMNRLCAALGIKSKKGEDA